MGLLECNGENVRNVGLGLLESNAENVRNVGYGFTWMQCRKCKKCRIWVYLNPMQKM